MDNSVTFVDCPAYMDQLGAVRCGLPAEVQDRRTMTSTGGPLEAIKIRCPRGHWFNAPSDFLAVGVRAAGQIGRRHRTGPRR